jgi:hypothetical protein
VLRIVHHAAKAKKENVRKFVKEPYEKLASKR